MHYRTMILVSAAALGTSHGAAGAQEATSADTGEAEEIVVIGDAFSPTDGYLARSASTATRLPVTVDGIPNTVRVLPTELFDDLRATLPQDVTRFVSGVQDIPGTGTGTSFLIRGFFTNYDLLQNGVRYRNSPGDLVGVERIEIVKGPVGSLYGGTGPFAGAVNYITKRPLDDFAAQARATVGSFEFYRAEVDVGGPIVASAGLNGRLTAAVESAGSFRDRLEGDKVVINPSVAFAPSERFDIRIDGQYIERDYIAGGGFTLDPNSLSLPPERTFIPDGQPRSSDRFLSIAYESNFRITDSLTWRSAGGWNRLRSDPRRSVRSTLDADGRTVNRAFSSFDSSYRQWSIQNDLIFRTDAIFQEALLLAGYERYEFKDAFTNLVFGALVPVDLQTPGSERDGTVLDSGPSGHETYRNDGDGVYGQIFVKLTPRFAVLGALRHDWITSSSPFAATEQKDSEFSPRVGATYDLSGSTTLYGNWARSFFPNAAFLVDRTNVEVDRVEQFEAGLRQYFLDRKVLASVALFDIERSNVLIPDPAELDGFPFISGGPQRSRGVEFDLTGRLAPGWDLLVAYAYTDAEVTGNDPNRGNRLTGVPEHTVSVLSTYQLQNGPLAGLSFTAGLAYQTEAAGDVANSVFLPETTRVDLGLAYERDAWRAALNVSNVTDEESFATDFFNLTPRAPRTVLFTLTRRFGEGA